MGSVSDGDEAVFAALADATRRQLLDSLHDGIYIADRERRITYWNRGAETITGFSREEAIGCHCHDTILVYSPGRPKEAHGAS